jgi:hypothetical protein
MMQVELSKAIDDADMEIDFSYDVRPRAFPHNTASREAILYKPAHKGTVERAMQKCESQLFISEEMYTIYLAGRVLCDEDETLDRISIIDDVPVLPESLMLEPRRLHEVPVAYGVYYR